MKQAVVVIEGGVAVGPIIFSPISSSFKHERTVTVKQGFKLVIPYCPKCGGEVEFSS